MEKKKAIYILTETLEGADGLREFQILQTSYKIKKLRKLMKIKIETDEYGYIEYNGIRLSNENCFITNWTDDGFIQYTITKNSII